MNRITKCYYRDYLMIFNDTCWSNRFLGFTGHGRYFGRNRSEIGRIGKCAQVVDSSNQRLRGSSAIGAVVLAVVLIKRFDLLDQCRRRIGHILQIQFKQLIRHQLQSDFNRIVAGIGWNQWAVPYYSTNSSDFKHFNVISGSFFLFLCKLYLIYFNN